MSWPTSVWRVAWASESVRRATPKSRIEAGRSVDENVRRLEVAMDKAALMRVLHGVADSGDKFKALAGVELVLVAVGEEILAVDQFHGEVRLPTERGLSSTRFVDLGDAGMLQSSQRLRFVLEAVQHFTRGVTGADDFESDSAMRVLLLRLVVDAHAAFARAGTGCGNGPWIPEHPEPSRAPWPLCPETSSSRPKHIRQEESWWHPCSLRS